MQKIEYATMAERESTYWWHLGRLRIIETYLQKATNGKKNVKILNVGCGTGGTLALLEKYGVVDNIDISDDAIAFMKQLGYSRIKKVNDIALPFKDESYDLVVAFDVLEHIKEDEQALKEWHRVLTSDGAVIITVPAYQWLWGEHDVSLHHQRRYTTRLLKRTANAAGLTPGRLSYAIAFSLPLVVGFRTLHKLSGRKADSETSYVDVPNWVNTLFSQLLYVEAKFHNFVRFPAGTSVITSLRKK
ncbi:MAG: methyltransferase type 11 [Candidatus Saccharibacteria bacterium]|nr:methyltransferase type 11 [Candidatus Saccharibacteria bacterium]